MPSAEAALREHDPVTRTVTGVLAVLLVDHQPQHRAWAWLRLARGSAALRGTPGLLFSKVMGSGEDGGFSLRPSGTHQGLVALFETQAQAQAFFDGPIVEGYRQRARQWWSGLMAVSSARGSWDGISWAATPDKSLRAGSDPQAQGVLADPTPREAPGSVAYGDAGLPLAILTRASIRPKKAVSFWRRAPRTEQALAEAEGCQLAIGLGEAPLLRQCTFSVWRDLAAMTAYAHSGAHGRAAQSAWREGHFSESMFVRMTLLASAGDWPTPSEVVGG